MLVLLNHATRFTVAIYQVKRKDLKNVPEMMKKAISNTLRYMNINHEIVDEYIRLCGEVTFVKNNNRSAAAWVSKSGVESAIYVADEYNGIPKMFLDTVGARIIFRPVIYSSNFSDSFIPYEKMRTALSELTGKQAYKYRAYELLVTLDLGVYKAVRKLIVPADLEFTRLHKVLQSVFDWDNYHLYNFSFFGEQKRRKIVLTVPFEEDWGSEDIVSIDGHVLSEFMEKYERVVYTYDFGDNWRHEIKLLRVIEEFDKESPYLLEASGQTPPEYVGGVGGFLEFREIVMNPDHPRYEEMRAWARFWSPELSVWQKRPRVIY